MKTAHTDIHAYQAINCDTHTAQPELDAMSVDALIAEAARLAKEITLGNFNEAFHFGENINSFDDIIGALFKKGALAQAGENPTICEFLISYHYWQESRNEEDEEDGDDTPDCSQFDACVDQLIRA